MLSKRPLVEGTIRRVLLPVTFKNKFATEPPLHPACISRFRGPLRCDRSIFVTTFTWRFLFFELVGFYYFTYFTIGVSCGDTPP